MDREEEIKSGTEKEGKRKKKIKRKDKIKQVFVVASIPVVPNPRIDLGPKGTNLGPHL
jgi:hypothetical protein